MPSTPSCTPTQKTSEWVGYLDKSSCKAMMKETRIRVVEIAAYNSLLDRTATFCFFDILAA